MNNEAIFLSSYALSQRASTFKIHLRPSASQGFKEVMPYLVHPADTHFGHYWVIKQDNPEL
jgi:hypothetical protein